MTVRVVLPPEGVTDPRLVLAASYGGRLEAQDVQVKYRVTTGEFIATLAGMMGSTPDAIEVYLERSITCRAAKPDVESAALAQSLAAGAGGDGSTGAGAGVGAGAGAAGDAAGTAATEDAGAGGDPGAMATPGDDQGDGGGATAPTRALERMRFPKRAVGHWFAAVNGATATDRVLVVPKQA